MSGPCCYNPAHRESAKWWAFWSGCWIYLVPELHFMSLGVLAWEFQAHSSATFVICGVWSHLSSFLPNQYPWLLSPITPPVLHLSKVYSSLLVIYLFVCLFVSAACGLAGVQVWGTEVGRRRANFTVLWSLSGLYSKTKSSLPSTKTSSYSHISCAFIVLKGVCLLLQVELHYQSLQIQER